MNRPVLRMPPPALADDAARARIASLETDVEHWRQRALEAEAVLRGEGWHAKVAPLSLTQTRILRLLTRHNLSTDALVAAMLPDNPNISRNTVKVHISRIRQKLPHLAPPVMKEWGTVYVLPDRKAAAVFLGEPGAGNGELPGQWQGAAVFLGEYGDAA